MDREEQIKEKEAMVSDLDKNSKCFILGFSEEWTTEDFVDELYRLGYRKIVWHKVADGDLPKRDSKDIYAVPVQAYYIDRNGMKSNGSLYYFFIDNITSIISIFF